MMRGMRAVLKNQRCKCGQSASNGMMQNGLSIFLQLVNLILKLIDQFNDRA